MPAFATAARFPRSAVAEYPPPGAYGAPPLPAQPGMAGRMNRRQRNTTPMFGEAASASLNGLDQVRKINPGPAPGSYEIGKTMFARKSYDVPGKTKSFLFGSDQSRLDAIRAPLPPRDLGPEAGHAEYHYGGYPYHPQRERCRIASGVQSRRD